MAERSNIESEIRDRAQRDAQFRERLLADARATLAADHGIDIPDSLTIRVVEEGADEVVLVIPQARSSVEDLSDAELEETGAGWGSGGGTCGDTCPATCQPGCI